MQPSDLLQTWRSPRTWRRHSIWPRLALFTLQAAAAVWGVVLLASKPAPVPRPAVAPEYLSETGLYVDTSSGVLQAGVRAFTPQYPLWSDGAAKRRWVYLPEGAPIDASDAYAWSFPVGTKFWKEFSFGRRVETRYMERVADGSWLFATYVWPEGGVEAFRAPEEGMRALCATGQGARHDIPSVQDCRACHDASASRVLGFGALQLTSGSVSERDTNAPHAETPAPDALGLDELLASGRLLGSPSEIRAAARPIDARTPRERAALGYLHANCGGCHNSSGPLASLGLELAYRHELVPPALRTALARPSRYQPTGSHDALRIAPGDPEHSVLFQRMASRFGPTQMPPLGTHAVDESALALMREWIRSDLAEPVVVASESH